MAITLVATAGASNANTYCTLADAETYFESRLHKSDWDSATDANKNIALAMATRMLDNMFDWYGVSADEDQALLWPRYWVSDRKGWIYDSDEIPTELRDATAELALFLLDADWSKDDDTKGFRRISVGSGAVSLEVNPADRKKQVPDSVVQMVKHLGDYDAGGYNVRIMRG